MTVRKGRQRFLAYLDSVDSFMSCVLSTKTQSLKPDTEQSATASHRKYVWRRVVKEKGSSPTLCTARRCSKDVAHSSTVYSSLNRWGHMARVVALSSRTSTAFVSVTESLRHREMRANPWFGPSAQGPNCGNTTGMPPRMALTPSLTDRELERSVCERAFVYTTWWRT